MILAWANMQELMTFAFALTFTCLITALGLATFFHKRSRAVAGENLELRDHLIGLQDRLDQFDEQQNAEFPMDRFLLRIVHEMRTPLNAIKGTIGMVEESDLDRHQQQLVRMIRLGNDNLSALLDDIQRFSRIESGLESSVKSEFDPRELVESAVGQQWSPLGNKAVEVIYTLNESVPHRLNGDAEHIAQILNSFLANAVKFTRRGIISITVGFESLEESEAELTISVKDTGIGISKEHLKEIFNPVVADDGDQGEIVVSGFGNYLSQRICSIMGGSMWVDSEEYVGSTFSFKVPVSNVAGERPSIDLKGLVRVAIVSQSEAYREFLSALTQLADVQVKAYPELAEMFKDASAEAWSEETALIIDADMWEGRGVDQDRDFENLKTLPARLVTVASPTAWKRVRGHEVLQRTAILPKPVTGAALFDRLATARSPLSITNELKKSRGNDNVETEKTSTKNLQILIAEDNKVNQQVTRLLLGRLGLKGDVAEDGCEVLEKLQENHYDVILMDINMPNMNGIDTAREIFHRFPNPEDRPVVIALTAAVTTATQAACREVGMKGFISKPVKLSVLQKALQSVKDPIATQ